MLQVHIQNDSRNQFIKNSGICNKMLILKLQNEAYDDFLMFHTL